MKIVARRQQEKLRGCLMLPLAFVYFVLLPGTSGHVQRGHMGSRGPSRLMACHAFDVAWEVAKTGPVCARFCTSIMLHEDGGQKQRRSHCTHPTLLWLLDGGGRAMTRWKGHLDVYMIESQLRGQMDDIFGEVEACQRVASAR